MQKIIGASLVIALIGIGQDNDPVSRVRVSTDLVWLEQLAGTAGAAEAIRSVYAAKSVRASAYLRLGEIGSPDAIAAVRRVEASARAWSLHPPTVLLDAFPHPSAHFSDSSARPFVQVTAPDGLTYALIQLSRLGGLDAFLVTSRTPGDPRSWSRPRLLPHRSTRGIAEPVLSWVSADELRLAFDFPGDRNTVAFLQPWMPPPPDPPGARPGRQTWTIGLTQIMRDQDGDGWSDIEEQRLGMNSTSIDSDADGIADGIDVCPLHAASPLEASSEEAIILAKVFFAGFGIHHSQDLLIVGGRSRPIQLWGSRAPVLYGIDRTEWTLRWNQAPLQLSWRLSALSKDGAGVETATVEFGDYQGPMAAAGYTATLRRLDNEWFVVKIVMNWIS